ERVVGVGVPVGGGVPVRGAVAAADVTAAHAHPKVHPPPPDGLAVLASVARRRDVGDRVEVGAGVGHGGPPWAGAIARAATLRPSPIARRPLRPRRCARGGRTRARRSGGAGGTAPRGGRRRAPPPSPHRPGSGGAARRGGPRG